MKKRAVIAIEITNDRIDLPNHQRYKSISATGKAFNINPGLIKYCCEGQNGTKSGFSKDDNRRY
ncbi:MAG: hypothetical protein KZQ69_17265, partial [gamma proteobacterium symbiont of Bathyaustriella thionipta]|nr:hypothetical protein [gamma proteobacterium symbiont of Bathyaustriella thionipta]